MITDTFDDVILDKEVFKSINDCRFDFHLHLFLLKNGQNFKIMLIVNGWLENC